MKSSTKTLSSKLTAYATVAGAATMASTAHAAVSLYNNGGSGWTVNANTTLGFNSSGGINVSNDFVLRNNYCTLSSTGSRDWQRVGSNRADKDRFSSGALISASAPGMNFKSGSNFTTNSFSNYGWAPGTTGFMALEFNDGFTTNYGWASITLDTFGPGQTIQLNSFAVENTPGLGILAGSTVSIPEVSSLTMASLILGAAGVFALRRRKND